jgi:hypothetical protein
MTPRLVGVELLEAAALPAGVCRFCGCTEVDACVVDDGFGPVGCSWIDRERRVCSACVAAARAELHHLGAGALPVVDRPAAAWARAAWLRAFHLGFVVGWFAVSPRTRAGRSTYLQPTTRRAVAAWQRGHGAGTAARVRYGSTCGPVTNLPRPRVLAAYAGRQAARRRPGRDVPDHPAGHLDHGAAGTGTTTKRTAPKRSTDG